jgi:hypothetical protein
MWLLVPEKAVVGKPAEAWESRGGHLGSTAHPQSRCITAAGAEGVHVGRCDAQLSGQPSEADKAELTEISRDAALCVVKEDERGEGQVPTSRVEVRNLSTSRRSLFIRRAGDKVEEEVKALSSTLVYNNDTLYLLVRVPLRPEKDGWELGFGEGRVCWCLSSLARPHIPHHSANLVLYRDATVANRNARVFGWEIAHEAVSRRPPSSL